MSATLAAPRVHRTRVLDRRTPAPGIVVIGLHAPDLCAAARPGHYVMAITPGAAAATALGVYEAAGDRVSLLILECGPRTKQLAGLAPGDALDLLAPLGNGFALDGIAGETAIVAGGVGLASVYLAARELRARGCPVTLYYGARSAELLVDAQLFEELGCVLAVATDDGSAGARGYVTELLGRAPERPRAALACGPGPMLRAVTAWADATGIPTQVSLEETFACGVGACWGCVVPIDPRSAQAAGLRPSVASAGTSASCASPPVVNARICKEGPVFWAHELRW